MIRSVAPDGRPDLGGAFQPIDRPRVVDRIATAAQYRIATIIAPAGFGKSVALRQFLATVRSFVVYDVPSDATALVPFVRGFADALHDVVPALRRSLSTAIEGVRESETPGRDLASWAATHIRSLDTLLVIDDLHVGEDDPEISKFIVALAERTKNGPRWLFSSRSPLQLPIASWLAYGESDLVVDVVDLRFDFAEAKLSARATRIAVRDDELTAILDLTEGWPAALAFALRTSTRASDLRTVSAGTREMVYRYLAEQVWHSLDDRIRAFLRTAAFLPRLETRLVVAAGFDDATAIIEMLRERVAFVSVLEPNVYKLHDLFRDFVQRQVEMEGAAALRAAQTAAGLVLETVGMPGAALDRYIEARANDDIERVLVSANFNLLESGHIDTVERAIRVLPASRLSVRAEMLGIRAAIEDSRGRIDQATKWYIAAIERADQWEFRVSVTVRYALFCQQRAQFEAVELLEALLTDERLTTSQRAHVLGIMAATYALAGRRDEAKSAIDEALALADYGDDELRARTFSRATVVAFYDSDEETLEAYAREGIRLANELGSFLMASRLCGTLQSMHALAGRTPAAIWYATQAASNAEQAGDPYMRTYALRLLLNMEAERGDAERINAIQRELASVSYRGPVALYGEIIGRGISLSWEGKYAEARSALSVAAESDLLPAQNRVRLALLACVAAGCPEQAVATAALAAYEHAVAAETDTRPIFDRLRALGERFAVLAATLLGRNAAAARMLRGLRHRRDEFAGFDATLHALQNRTPEALEEGLRAMRLAGQAGFARFLETIALTRPESVRSAEDREGLTAAEAQTLRGLCLGLSNQAIADEQGRTVNTIRTHVSAVLRKLGAGSRGEAVATARRQGLIT